MRPDCIKHFECFEYRIPSRQLYIRKCNTMELERLLRRRNFYEAIGIYEAQAIIRFIEIELLRRGKIVDAALIEALMDGFPRTGVKVYRNSTSLLVAVRTFFTADSLLDD